MEDVGGKMEGCKGKVIQRGEEHYTRWLHVDGMDFSHREIDDGGWLRGRMVDRIISCLFKLQVRFHRMVVIRKKNCGLNVQVETV